MIEIPVHRIPGHSCKAKGRSTAFIVATAIVDDECAGLARFFWTLCSGYAARHERGRLIFMHLNVIGRLPGKEVSHENANKLDNRRINLRHVSRSENVLNPNDPARGVSGYRGVTRDRKPLRKPWRGKVEVAGRTRQTSRFTTPTEAAAALQKLRENLGIRQWPGDCV